MVILGNSTDDVGTQLEHLTRRLLEEQDYNIWLQTLRSIRAVRFGKSGRHSTPASIIEATSPPT
jgi:hypothetical protein